MWAQDVGFAHAEEALFDTTNGEHLYELAILGNTYTLSGDGQLLLSNQLHDYSAFGEPYSLPNFLVIGDDTGSAAANINLGRVTLTVNDPATAPIAPTWPLFLLGLVAIRSLYCQASSRASTTRLA